jgi:hypothetical protein
MSIDGKWEITIDTPIGKQVSVLELKGDGGSLSGTASSDGDTVEIYDGSVDGDSATWKTDITKPFELTVTFTAELSGDQISGKAQAGAFPPAPFSGSRQ